jgi:hypothetical protein
MRTGSCAASPVTNPILTTLKAKTAFRVRAADRSSGAPTTVVAT